MTILRIWDLRRGDADDNRTSPHGRGLRSIVLSAALEFNSSEGVDRVSCADHRTGPAGGYRAVSCGHLWPSDVPQSDFGRKPSNLCAVSLAVLVGAALWIGRPLLALAVDHFWHLHYTLVFPIFVALRELLRTVGRTVSRPVDLSGTAQSPTPDRHRLGRAAARWRRARPGNDRRALDRSPTRRCRARPAVGGGKGGAGQCGGDPRPLHCRREPLLALA